MKEIFALALIVFPASLFAQENPIRINGTKNGLPENVLFVIDGKKIEKTDIKRDSTNAIVSLNSIDPNDIESITVLKDESATKAYGDSGKNGVIIIETKEFVRNKFKRH